MTFKEQIQADTSIFVNRDEFADKHTINGADEDVIEDNNEMLERQTRIGQHGEGIYKKQLLIYVRKSETMSYLPKIGSLLEFDGKPYKVIDAINEAGIFSITLEANQS